MSVSASEFLKWLQVFRVRYGNQPDDNQLVAVASSYGMDSLSTWTYNNGSNGIGATLTAPVNGNTTFNGILAVDGDVIFVIDQDANLQWQGLYTLQQGTGSTPTVLTRAPYFDTQSNLNPGDIVTVLEGDEPGYAGTQWMLTAHNPIVVGTTPLTFTKQTTLDALLIPNNLSDVASIPTARANLQVAHTTIHSGNPNTFVAGALGDIVYDSSNSYVEYICTTAGSAGTAVWEQQVADILVALTSVAAPSGKFNSIDENTATSGVTIDGLLIKDNAINNSTSTVAANRLYNGATWNIALGGAAPSNGQVLTWNGTNAVFATNAGGDITGPASSTNNAFVIFDGETGKLVKNSALTFSAGAITGLSGDLTINSAANLVLNPTGTNVTIFPGKVLQTDFIFPSTFDGIVDINNVGLINGEVNCGTINFGNDPGVIVSTVEISFSNSILVGIDELTANLVYADNFLGTTSTLVISADAIGSNAAINFNSNVLTSAKMALGGTIYTTGTISQSGNTVTGVGTTFTNEMFGGLIRYANGTSAIITNVVNATTLTVAESASRDPQAYSLHYDGLQLNLGDYLGIENILTESISAQVDLAFTAGGTFVFNSATDTVSFSGATLADVNELNGNGTLFLEGDASSSLGYINMSQNLIQAMYTATAGGTVETGTMSQVGQVITVSAGVTFESYMLGGGIRTPDGNYQIVQEIISSTQVRVGGSLAYAPTSFSIFYGGVQIGDPGAIGANDIIASNTIQAPIGAFDSILCESIKGWRPVVAQSASYTLAASDANTFQDCSSASTITVEIPNNSTTPFVVGTEIDFLWSGVGAVTFTGAGGVTIVSVLDNKTISNRYGVASLKKMSTNVWLLTGALTT